MRRAIATIFLNLVTLTATSTAHAGGFDRAIETVLPRVVKLYGMGAGLQAGYGTGVLVSEDGLVLTVFSLLIDARRIRAVTADGTPYEADVVYRDLDRQLALLRLKPSTDEETRTDRRLGPFPFFDLSRAPGLAPGDWIVAAGNAFKVAEGAEPVSLAHGVFSIRTRLDARRKLKDFPYHGEVLVFDAVTSNPGAPGSAVVNLEGEFVGMIGRVVTSNRTHTNFNYAVPHEVLHDFFVEATYTPSADGDSPKPKTASPVTAANAADLGMRLNPLGFRKVLPFVEQVRSGSPADRAGLRKDDLVLAVNGVTVNDVTACDARLGALAPMEKVDLVIRRGRDILTMRLEPEVKP